MPGRGLSAQTRAGAGKIRMANPDQPGQQDQPGRHKLQARAGKDIFFYLYCSYKRRNSSGSRSRSSRIILRINPLGRSSFLCTGTVVARPSGCLRRWWEPFTRITIKPSFCRNLRKSLPEITGNWGITSILNGCAFY